MRKLPLMAIAAAFGFGCTEPNPAYNPDPLLPGECRSGNRTTQTFEDYERPDQLDILLVVDNSGDVEDIQRKFAVASIAWLEDLKSRGISVHAAVTTADLDGRAFAPAGKTGEGCAQNTQQLARSSQSNWTSTFACNVQQGRSGDPFQQSLQKVEFFFEQEIPEMVEFLRPTARKLVIVLSNEDDCSHGGTLTDAGRARQECFENREFLRSLEDYKEGWTSVHISPEGLSFAAITGPPSSEQEELRPVCSASGVSAFAGNRLATMSELFGEQGLFSSICVEEYGPTLGTITRRLGIASTVSLCAERVMAHEPLAVTAIDSEGSETPIRLGASGFVYLGATDECENGLLEFQASALAATSATSIEMEYCTP